MVPTGLIQPANYARMAALLQLPFDLLRSLQARQEEKSTFLGWWWAVLCGAMVRVTALMNKVKHVVGGCVRTQPH
jgi:hypothetical protein